MFTLDQVFEVARQRREEAERRAADNRLIRELGAVDRVRTAADQ